MKHYKLRNVQQYDGAFTDLYILGTTRAAAGASDFTAAAGTQTFNLQALVVGDIVSYPLAVAWVKTAFTVVTNPKLDVGVTAAATQFIAGVNNDLATLNKGIVGVAAGAPLSSGVTNLMATITTTVGNISTIGAGEVWIYATICRLQDFLSLRDA